MARTSRRTFLVGSAVLPVTAAMAKLPVDLQARVGRRSRQIYWVRQQAGGRGRRQRLRSTGLPARSRAWVSRSNGRKSRRHSLNRCAAN